jgi:hypothetical protein
MLQATVTAHVEVADKVILLRQLRSPLGKLAPLVDVKRAMECSNRRPDPVTAVPTAMASIGRSNIEGSGTMTAVATVLLHCLPQEKAVDARSLDELDLGWLRLPPCRG